MHINQYKSHKAHHLYEHPKGIRHHRHTPNQDVLSFNSAISACEKSTAWRWALQLFQDVGELVQKGGAPPVM